MVIDLDFEHVSEMEKIVELWIRIYMCEIEISNYIKRSDYKWKNDTSETILSEREVKNYILKLADFLCEMRKINIKYFNLYKSKINMLTYDLFKIALKMAMIP